MTHRFHALHVAHALPVANALLIRHHCIVKIDTSAFRSIHVELTPNIEPEAFCDLPTFEIRDGLRTKFYRPHHRKDTLVTISWLDLETPDELITHVFSHFGGLKSNIQWVKIKQESNESEKASEQHIER